MTKRRTSRSKPKKESFSDFIIQREKNFLIGRISFSIILMIIGKITVKEAVLQNIMESAIFYPVVYITEKIVNEEYAIQKRKTMLTESKYLSILLAVIAAISMTLTEEQIEKIRFMAIYL